MAWLASSCLPRHARLRRDGGDPVSRGELSESEWRVLKDLLPIEAVNRGRARRLEQNRAIINDILWRLRCGTPWRDVPPKYGNWNTIYRRFRRWSEAGVGGCFYHAR
ncbi:transposase [Ochrobactrum teleogrylli]|uniref:Transposase n=1 Tax=Ochrobactrum teleogrylli TaxID=2479765 RepID=A0ABY2XYT0_9HYPH|nr:transposase [[Ochrobactrum] teleogrylli]TNV10093.1 transposase [[Ochrobactrum] teleogrylli]